MNSRTARVAAVLALASTASAQVGSAIVNNNCDTPVYLWNTPSSGGGGTEVDQTIAPGSSYSQTYQSLTNNNGWSLKLAPTDSQNNLMQFEYTYQNAGVVWFDISYVNGDPFNSNWFLSASDPTCVPKQTYYRYSTDDQNGMQPTCSPSNDIILTICPGGASGSSSSSSSSSSSPPPESSSSPPPPSSSSAAPSTTAAPSQPILAEAPAVDAVFTTFITQVVTVDVTAVEKRNPEPTAAAKREAHAHDHQHFHRHAHAHAHGHA